MELEQQYVAATFQESLHAYANKKIILYGVGRNTGAVLSATKGFSFLGLMDQNTERQSIYGYAVLSEAEAMEGYADDRIIVIVARDSVVPIIYKRIAHLNKDYGIPILDYKGTDLSKCSTAFVPVDIPYWQLSYEGLLSEIDRHDVISFDVFDTLLMRKCLYPTDVFEIVEKRLSAVNMEIPFARYRKEAEEKIGKQCPNLDEIYAEMGRLFGVEPAVLEKAKNIEKETDRHLIHVRAKIADAFNYAKEKGKKVYIVSDMYYTKEYLEELLSENGINGYDGLFVSNEWRCTKEEGEAYKEYLDAIGRKGGRGFLHIGDNRIADGEQARKHGIDTFMVYSAYELFMASSLRAMLVDTARFSTRCVLGLLAFECFNNPFAVNKTKGRLKVSSLEMLGYVFMGPMIEEFVRWAEKAVIDNGITQLLFPSRDGYIIKKAYDILSEESGTVKTVYFRTSRRAVTVSGICSLEDIERILGRKYNGTVKGLMRERFGIELNEAGYDEIFVLPENAGIVKRAVSEHLAAIFTEAESEKARYRTYLAKQGIDFDSLEHTLLFDFVTGGTVQYYLSKILTHDLRGICFATVNLPNGMYGADSEDFFSAYGNIGSYGNNNSLSKRYLVLEAVLTDERETFKYIDECGREVFAGDGENHSFVSMAKVQTGILNFVSDYKDLYNEIAGSIDSGTDFADKVFGEMFSDANIVDKDIKDVFINDDLYDGVEKYSVWQ